MPYQAQHLATEPSRESLDSQAGLTLLEFGTPWCGHCQRAQPLILQALNAHPAIAHVKVEDGPGRALGRSYRVKLWPTLVFLRDGVEVERLVRPQQAQELQEAILKLSA